VVFGIFGSTRDPNAPRPVLVVDDNEDIRSLVSDILEMNGYRVVTAANGRQGLEKARAENPCLILLDINMPDWSGLQTLTEMRRHEELRETPVLMVTAEQTGKDVESAFARGAKGYVIKPIEMTRFLKKVRDVVPAPGPA
jgi:DNA-binding response OmpR family regulator